MPIINININSDLADILANGASTGDIPMTSPDGLNIMLLADGTFQLASTDGADAVGVVSIQPLQVNASVSDGVNSAGLVITPESVQLTGNEILKNGEEIATENYVDGMVAGLLDDRGSYNASSNLFPATGGSGSAGAILKGDIWYISVAGILGGVPVIIGDSVRALTDTPGQTATNWSVLETNIGYVPENVANKTGTVVGNEASTSLYLHVKGYYDYLVGGFKTFLDTLYVSLSGSYVNPSWITSLAYSKITDVPNFLRILHESTTDGTVITGVTTNQITASVLIPGGTFTVGKVAKFNLRTIFTGANASRNTRIYFNTSLSLSGANLVGTVQTTTAQFSVDMGRFASIKSTTLTRVFSATTSMSGSENPSTAFTDVNIDWTVDQYFIVAIQLGSVADSGHKDYIKITY